MFYYFIIGSFNKFLKFKISILLYIILLAIKIQYANFQNFKKLLVDLIKFPKKIILSFSVIPNRSQQLRAGRCCTLRVRRPSVVQLRTFTTILRRPRLLSPWRCSTRIRWWTRITMWETSTTCRNPRRRDATKERSVNFLKIKYFKAF